MKKTIIIQGRVVAGRRLGRELGFPTANVHLPLGECTDTRMAGVWFARVCLSEAATVAGQRYWALVNVGTRPTVERGEGMCKVEAWLIDFEGDLYGQQIVIELVEYIRSEMKFDSLEQLQCAMNEDKKRAFKIIKKDEYSL